MSAFYNKPWSSGYALPAYLKKEDPLTRGSAVVTKMLPRGTISEVPPGFDYGGYAVPNYVKREPVGSQAATTPWTPRGTVMSMKGIKTGLPWKSSAHTLDSNGLGALGSSAPSKSTVGSEDPIEAYGQKAAATVAAELSAVPLSQRNETLKKILNEVDPKLYPMFKRESKRIEEMGVDKPQAAQKGLQVAFTQGFVQELMRIGKAGKAPTPGTRKGAVPLGALVGFDAQTNNYQDLGSVLSTIKDTVKKLGGLACDVATHPIAPLAAGAAGAYYGGAQGASTATAGAGIAATACSSGSTGGPAFAPVPAGPPAWALPAIIGGGAIALLLILRK